VNTLENDLKYLGTQDVIVVNGGSNDIGSKRNQTHKVLVHMAQFIQENIHSNIIIVNIPPRHDIGNNSITNLEIHATNMKLSKIAKAYNNVTIVVSLW
jgi:lysophospholipase L1-like esterase